MPCRDQYTEDYEYQERQATKLENTISLLESFLCSTCRVLERTKYDFDENPALSEWWASHKAEDERREAALIKKRLRWELAIEVSNKPVNSLTEEDKKLLREFELL
jgi:hypothetical protein